ncbi:uncharacterized protein [Taeniopygia guttata]|uniref:uncharacterized protein isoform X3 n=1 Tax=Taeniopygia guttata TaxID=59729 RepID=UPI003BB94560
MQMSAARGEREMADARAGGAHTNARVRVPPSVRPRPVRPSLRARRTGMSDPGQQRLPPVPCPPAARRPRPRSLVRVLCDRAVLGEEMCLYHLSTSPCSPAFAGSSTAASLSHCRNRSGNSERNLWTASNEIEARADESFELFSSGRSSMSFRGGTRICSFVAQYYRNVPVTARGLAITPDNVSGILGCGLENCRDPFGHLPGEEDVESSLQSSQDVLLEAGQKVAALR